MGDTTQKGEGLGPPLICLGDFRARVSLRVRYVAELFEGKPAFLGTHPVMCIKALLAVGGYQLGALFAGHEAASPAALKAISVRDMLETPDLAFAAALETFE